MLSKVESKFRKMIYYANKGIWVPNRDSVNNGSTAKKIETLVQLCSMNNITLVLPSFNMAVDENSPQEVIKFYESVFSTARLYFEDTKKLDAIYLDLSQRYKGVYLIGVSSEVNLHYEDAFIDLVHLTQIGRDRFANHIYNNLLNYKLLAQR
jgi:hypothetical protein